MKYLFTIRYNYKLHAILAIGIQVNDSVSYKEIIKINQLTTQYAGL